jgi:hypothetical protein
MVGTGTGARKVAYRRQFLGPSAAVAVCTGERQGEDGGHEDVVHIHDPYKLLSFRDFDRDCLLGDIVVGEDFLDLFEVDRRLLWPGSLRISYGIKKN